MVEKLNFEAVIKSAASAASPKTKIQESGGASGRRVGWWTTGTARLPWIILDSWILIFGEAALAADLIKA